jgi:hypothetical protein
MQEFRRLRAIAHTSFWAIMLAAFLCISAPKVLRNASQNCIHFVGPFHSSDSFLHFATGGARNASVQLLRLFDSLPSQELVLIFVRGDDTRSSSLGMITAYLAWPHPVRIIDIAHSGRESDRNIGSSDSIGAVVFCRVGRPSWFPSGERFGETLEVVPIRKIAAR